MEIDKIEDDSKIDREKNIDRRGQRQIGTDWHIPDPPTFWLPTTFKEHISTELRIMHDISKSSKVYVDISKGYNGLCGYQ